MKVNEKAALENLVRVCEASLGLIRTLIESQDQAYIRGFEDGMEARKKIHEPLAEPQEDAK
jgi:hypothetical protein